MELQKIMAHTYHLGSQYAGLNQGSYLSNTSGVQQSQQSVNGQKKVNYELAQNLRGAVNSILSAETNFFLLQDLTEEQVKKEYTYVDLFYKDFIEAQKNVIQSSYEVSEWSQLVDLGEKIKNKVIYMRTKLNEVLDAKSDRNNVADATDDDLNSLFKKQKCIIERIESLEPVEHDLDVDETKVLTNYLTSLYELFTSNQLKIEKYVNCAELDAELIVSKSIQEKVTFFLTKLRKSSKKADLPEPTEPFDVNIDLYELFKTRGSFISQIKSLETELLVDNAVEIAPLSYRLTQINDSFISVQTKIETLVRHTQAQHRQLEIGKKIRQKLSSMRERLDEVSKSSNDMETDANQAKQTILDALNKIEEALQNF